MVNLGLYLSRESRFKSDDSRALKDDFLNSIFDALEEYNRIIGSAAIYTTGGSNTEQDRYIQDEILIALKSPAVVQMMISILIDMGKVFYCLIWLGVCPPLTHWPAPQTRREPNPYRNVELLWQYSVWERHSQLS